MANYRLGEMIDICKKGAEASKAVQKARAKVKWEELNLKCLTCSKKFEWSEITQGCQQRRRRFCDSICTANYRWNKYFGETGKARPRKANSEFTEEPFLQKGDRHKGRVSIHARKVYFARFDPKTSGCELCGCVRICPEVAHVDPVCSFSDETQLVEINQLSNLIGLCPTCHRLYDSGMISRIVVKEAVSLRPPRSPLVLTEAETERWAAWREGKPEPRHKRRRKSREIELTA